MTTEDTSNGTLRERVSSLETAVEVMRAEQRHITELMTSRFAEYSSQNQAILSRMESLSLTLTNATNDPTQTFGGRTILERLSQVEESAKATGARVMQATGGLAVVLVLLTIFGPLLRAAVTGNPQ